MIPFEVKTSLDTYEPVVEPGYLNFVVPCDGTYSFYLNGERISKFFKVGEVIKADASPSKIAVQKV